MQTSGWSPLRAVLITGIGPIIALTGMLAIGSTSAEAKFKQAGCAKFKKKLKKAKGNKKLRLKYKLKECKANRKAYNQIKNSRFVGFRSDGLPVDIILCANGRFADDYGTGSGEVYKKGWRITGAKFRGKNFTAVYEALDSQTKTQISTRAGSLAKKKGKWQSGIGSSNFTEPERLGDVTKTNAKKICNKL
ncbi:MAG: hypothetical protein IPK93_06415 [Solirubrobacterales bacterium]|nr:hypothetical protein [Solirubrobacterales bacterium]